MTALQIPDAVSVSGVRQQGGASVPPCTTLRLPIPPSVNGMFKNLMPRGGKPGGRAKTRDYKNWIDEASVELRQQNCERVSGHVLIVLSVERDSLECDIDNRIKALLDLLVQPGPDRRSRVFGVIDDDKYVTGVAVSWAPRGSSRRGWARIAIMPVHNLTLTFHPSPDGATGGWFIDAPDDDGEV